MGTLTPVTTPHSRPKLNYVPITPRPGSRADHTSLHRWSASSPSEQGTACCRSSGLWLTTSLKYLELLCYWKDFFFSSFTLRSPFAPLHLYHLPSYPLTLHDGSNKWQHERRKRHPRLSI